MITEAAETDHFGQGFIAGIMFTRRFFRCIFLIGVGATESLRKYELKCLPGFQTSSPEVRTLWRQADSSKLDPMANFHLSLRLGGDATFRATLAFSLCHFLFFSNEKVYKKKAGGLLGLQAELADTSGVPTRSRHYRRNCILRKLQNTIRHWIWLEVETTNVYA